MFLDERISQLIAKIYQGAHDSAIWDQSLDSIMQYTDSRSIMVSRVDLKSGQYANSRFYGADDASFLDGVRDYDMYKYKTDPLLVYGKKNPNAGFVSTQIALSGSGTDYRDNAFTRWTRSVLGFGASVVCYTRETDDLIIGASLHVSAVRGAHSDADIRLFRMLFEHVKQSINIAARPIDLGSATEAVLLLDSDGTISAMSAMAEHFLAQSDGMAIKSRRLCIEDRGESARFALLLRSAIEVSRAGGVGGGIRISRPSGRQPWIVKISPLPFHPSPFGRSGVAAVKVQIICPDAPTEDNDRLLLAQLFGLTPAEAAVAIHLRKGLPDAVIASHMHVAPSTIRSHVKSILAKAEIHTKAELAHLLTISA